MDNGAKIDANGVLADGSKLSGPVELRQAISARPEAFATVITERMMVYALGRGLEPADMPVVRRIVKKAGQNGYRLSTIVNEIIESAPFQMRTRLEPAQQPLASSTEVKRGVNTMIITKKHLSRRTFLRGAFGATIALPMLDAMAPALTAQSRTAPPRRSGSGRCTSPAESIRTPGIPMPPAPASRSSR